MASFVSGDRHCRFEDFTVDHFLQQGGWGKVFAGTRKSDGKKCALKFFGYTNHRPVLQDIYQEIRLMISLECVEGVCQLLGVFDDTPEGLMPEKYSAFNDSYPVIVMEMLEGGDLFGRISSRPEVTENYLAVTFMSMVRALQSLHGRNFIHRDLKLDNVMLISEEDDSSVKLIDFGMMIGLDWPNESLVGNSIMGTEGYFSPESLTRMQYGYKSDVWQLGCILYAMLAGHPPFHSDKKYRTHIVRGRYYPMKGPNWDRISSDAKDLVAKVLDKNPDTRLSVEEILQHPWLQDVHCGADDTTLGEAYSSRIKHLVLRSKLKRCFAETSITNTHQGKKELFQSHLPFLDTPDVVMESEQMSLQEYFILSNEYNAKLLKLKELLVFTVANSESTDDQPASKKRKTASVNIDFDRFCTLMETVHLGLLCRQEIFSIFDEDGDGIINAKEFLLALMALRTAGDDKDREEQAAQLYFSLFDVNEDGMISKEEMAMVVDCLLHDGAGPMWDDESVTDVNIDDVFNACDTNQDGYIDFEEFSTFYSALLASSSIRIDAKAMSTTSSLTVISDS